MMNIILKEYKSKVEEIELELTNIRLKLMNWKEK